MLLVSHVAKSKASPWQVIEKFFLQGNIEGQLAWVSQRPRGCPQVTDEFSGPRHLGTRAVKSPAEVSSVDALLQACLANEDPWQGEEAG